MTDSAAEMNASLMCKLRFSAMCKVSGNFKWHLVGESQFAVGHTYVASQVTSVCSTVACVELRQSADGANDLWTLSFDFQDLFDLPGQTRGQGGGLHACHPHYGAT
eukprot:85822-Pelagomonas_calceolata.AAC.1